jgi:hypothetical protein
MKGGVDATEFKRQDTEQEGEEGSHSIRDGGERGELLYESTTGVDEVDSSIYRRPM